MAVPGLGIDPDKRSYDSGQVSHGSLLVQVLGLKPQRPYMTGGNCSHFSDSACSGIYLFSGHP